MIQSGIFWLVLGLATVVFWTLPARFRMGFLAAVSICFLAVGVNFVNGGWRGSLIGTASVLGWSLIFYWLAPRARRPAAAAQMPAMALAGAAVMGGAPANAAGNPPSVLEYAAPGPSPRFTGRKVLLLLIPSMVLYLICFKYIIPAITLAPDASVRRFIPLGLSYFTFKLIHYAIEMARGSIRDRSLPHFLAWMFLFPAFSAGPIERFDHFLANREHALRLQSLVEGFTRIIAGIIKKFIFAEILLRPAFDYASEGLLVQNLRKTPAWSVWLSATAVYLYLYMDFSAYSDIAIGGSRLFGLRLMENFNFPIIAANAADLWKRWHITLAGWCQSYIYMPVLGFTRNPYAAVYSTFIVIGLWHEASVPWLIWGLYHATGVVLYQALARTARARKWGALDRGAWRAVGIPLTFIFVVVGTVLVFGGLHKGKDIIHLLAKLIGINLGHG
jgi:alginate O-acetyltransferase complex protein AlgI